MASFRAAVVDLVGRDFDDEQLFVNISQLDSLMLAELLALADHHLGAAGASVLSLADIDPMILTFDRIIDMAFGVVSQGEEGGSVWDAIAHTVHLRPVNEQDVMWLRELVLRPEDAHRFMFRGRFGSPHSFLEDLTGAMAASFAVCERESMTPIGFAGIAGLNLQAQHAHVALAFAEQVRRTQYPIAGFLRLAEYAFRVYPLRKMYAQVADYSLAHSDAAVGLLVEEARLDEHEYFDGRLWGVTFYSISRAALNALAVGANGAERRATAVGPDGFVFEAAEGRSGRW